MNQSLADRTARAAQWRFAGTVVGAFSRFGIGIVLARLLAPADFGLTAIALIVVGFAQPLGDLGIGSAVVQRRELTERDIRGAFTFSIVVGLLVAATLALAAPAVAHFMRDVRVTPILRLLSIGFALGGISVVASALLRRNLDFKHLFFIDVASYLLGYAGVAVSMALLGYGVWSLVWGSLVQTLLSAVAQLAASRHSMRPLFAGREVGELLHYGVGAGGSSWVNYVALNGDNFIVGRTLGAASLGLYARAYTLMNLPYTYAASVMSGVLFPAFARMQDDMPRLRRAYVTMTQLTALVAAGSMATLAVSAPHLVRTLYGDRWAGVVTPLQILCGAGYFRALYHVGGIVAHSVGQVYSDLRRQILYATLVIVGAFGGSQYGLAGVAVGVAIAIMVMFVATTELALRITGTGFREYVRAQGGALAIGAITTVCALVARVALERSGAPVAVITIGTLLAAAIPWSTGALWMLGGREFETIRARLPRWTRDMVELVRFTNA